MQKFTHTDDIGGGFHDPGKRFQAAAKQQLPSGVIVIEGEAASPICGYMPDPILRIEYCDITLTTVVQIQSVGMEYEQFGSHTDAVFLS